MQDFSQLSPNKQKLLQQFLRAKLAQKASSQQLEIPRRNQHNHVPLSFAQQRLWFLDQLEAGNSSYNLSGAYRLVGPLQFKAFQQSIQEIVRRHETLRTQFVAQNGYPEQVILPMLIIPIPLIDLSALTQNEQVREIQRLSTEDAQRPFHLAEGPLLRIHLLRIQSDEHVQLSLFHHIIFDAWSIGVFLNELNVLYTAFSYNQSPSLPELPISYADYASWQRQWFQGELREQQTRYWVEQLHGMSPLNLPTDRPRPPFLSSRGAHYHVHLPQTLLEQLKILSQREGVTLFMTLVATFQILAYRYTHQTDIIIGTSVANRLRAGTEHLIGFLVNTLLLRTDLSGNPSSRTILKQVQRVVRDALTHQDMPFEELVAALQPERSLNAPPLIQVLFVFNNTPNIHLQLGQTTAIPIPVESGSTKFDIMVEIQETVDGLAISFEYSTDLFYERTIARFIHHWHNLMESVTLQPEQRIDTLPFLTTEEKQQLLIDWNTTATSYPLHESFLDLFAVHVHTTPERIAIVHNEEALTYKELDQRVTILALELQALNITTETLVALYLERSLDLLIAILATWKCGGAYLPLDPAYPQERLNAIVSDASPTVIVTTHVLQAALSFISHTKIHCLGSQQTPPIDAGLLAMPASHPQQLAYIIYTSGSTGKPKGVMVTQQGMLNHLLAKVQDLQLTSNDIVAQTASHCFDISVWQFLSALLTGGQTHIFSDAQVYNPQVLIQQTQEHELTILEVVPSLLNVVLQIEEEQLTHGLISLHWLLVTGEALSSTLCQHWFKQYPHLPLVNAYGPTECSDDVTHAFIYQQDEIDLNLPIPIGRPIANTQIYILDEHFSPVPVGHSGQIYVGGVGVGRGYLNDPEKTANTFLPNPFATTPGRYLYHTGDLGRYRADGTIEFLGRIDHQIKLRGYRIELGEIETLIAQEEVVRECVVRLWETTPDDQHLVAYIVPNEGVPIAEHEILQALARHLPAYMLPSTLLVLDAFPLTPNGKIDRAALPVPSFASASSAPSLLSSSPTEEMLASIYAEVLGLPHVQRTDQFFSLGGHSLLATQVVSRIRRWFHLDLPVRCIFEHPTVHALAQVLEQQRSGGTLSPLPPLLPAPREHCLPLSFAQQRLWFLHQFDPTNVAYHLPVALGLQGPLHVHAFIDSFRHMIARHDSLRTTFRVQHHETIQSVAPTLSFTLPLIDLTSLLPRHQEHAFQTLCEQDLHLPFDLSRGPLLRGILLRVQPEEHLLLFSMDHSISDGWSMGLLLREIRLHYCALLEHVPDPLPPLPLQYPDFALWQRALLSADYLAPHLRYWHEHLTDLPTVQLPTDFPRPAMQTFRGSQQQIRLPLVQLEALKALSLRSGSTLFMTLLSSFMVLLARYSGQRDLVVGTPIAGRTHPELEELIGFFVNTLVIRCHLQGDPTVEQVIAQLREVTLDAYAHQEVPFEQLVESLQLPRDPSRTPLFQVMFVLQNASTFTHLSEPFAGLHPRLLETKHTTAKFDLTLTVTEEAEGLACAFEYNTDLFASATIERMMQHWSILLAGVIAHPQARISTLPLLTPAERLRLLEVKTCNYPDDHLIHQYIEQQVQQNTDRVALVFQEEQLTYAEFNRRSNQLAHFLQSQGVSIGTLVGIYLERSLELPLIILAILKAGGTYVPLDPSLPTERLAFVLEDTRMPLILTQRSLQERIPKGQAQILCIDMQAAQIASMPEQNLEGFSAEVPAYIIYTSGSTGIPKGVVVHHKNVIRLFHATEQHFHFGTDDIWTLFHSYTFDFSVWELWGSLLYGGKLLVVPYLISRAPDMFSHLLEEQAVTVLNQTPSAFQQLMQVNEQIEGGSQLALRFVIFGGEALDPQRLRTWVQRYGLESPQLINMYGITETTVHVTYHKIDEHDITGERGSVIGSAIADLQVYVLDKYLQPVPYGVTGELYIGGAGVASGYLQRPALTSERFIPHPYSQTPGARLYRTGDLACLRSNGTIQYLGRIDEQVKIRGFRIELGEIETCLTQYINIQNAIVIARGEQGAERKLIAYVIPHDEESFSLKAMRSFLQKRLPDYMLPSAFVVIKSFPLTKNGKIDRQALPSPEEHIKNETASTTLHTPMEVLVADVWHEILGTQVQQAQDNFFDIGGQSLLATQIIARLRQIVQLELPLRIVFEHPTIEGLARQIEQRSASLPELQVPPLIPLPSDQASPLSFAQQRLWFLDQLDPENPAYTIPIAVQIQGDLNQRALEQSLATIIQRHESLRTRIEIDNDHQPIQIIQEMSVFHLPVIDLSALDHQIRSYEAQRLLQQITNCSFNLRTGPLFEMVLVQLDGIHFIFLLAMHHIVSDGWSLTVLVRELTALYNHLAAKKPLVLDSLPIQYRDYATWQRQWLQGNILAQHLDYWQQQLTGAHSLDLPTDYPYPIHLTQNGAHYLFTLPAQLTHAIQELGRQEGTTLFMTLLAAFQTLLYHHTKQSDIVVGTDIANRTHVETERLIGFFVNLLALRTNLSGNPSFRHVLQRVREVVLGAYNHYEAPFEMLIERLKPEHAPNRLPLVQVLFVLQNFPNTEIQLTDITLKVLQQEITRAKFEIALFLQEGKDGLEGIVVYNTDLFQKETIATMMQQFEALLDSVTQQSDTPINLLTTRNQVELIQEADQRKERMSTSLRKLKRGKDTA